MKVRTKCFQLFNCLIEDLLLIFTSSLYRIAHTEQQKISLRPTIHWHVLVCPQLSIIKVKFFSFHPGSKRGRTSPSAKYEVKCTFAPSATSSLIPLNSLSCTSSRTQVRSVSDVRLAARSSRRWKISNFIKSFTSVKKITSALSVISHTLQEVVFR